MRKYVRSAAVAALALGAGACSTMSFSPPHVATSERIREVDPKFCTAEKDSTPVTINPDVIGAIDLVNNYLKVYGCAEDELANGRQVFEVPAFVAATIGLVGPQFGLAADAVLAEGAYASVLKAGNSYYAPKAKAGLLTMASRAMECVRSEAVGISFFRTTPQSQGNGGTDSNAKRNQIMAERAMLQGSVGTMKSNLGDAAAPGTLASIEAAQARLAEIDAAMAEVLLVETLTQLTAQTVPIDSQRQYFEMVSHAAASVHSILRERVRDAGTPEFQDTFEQLKQLATESKDKDDKVEELREEQEKLQSAVATNLLTKGFSANDSVNARLAAAVGRKALVDLEIDALHPKLQACVLMARQA